MGLEARFVLSVAWFMLMARTSPQKDSSFGSDSMVLWTLLIIGLLPVIDAVFRRQAWGVWPSLGMLMVGFAIFAFVRGARERRSSRKGQ